MGDVAMTVPIISSMIDTYKGNHIYILSSMAYAPFFEHLEDVHFIGINLKHYKGIAGLYRIYEILRQKKFDIVIDLHDVLRTKILRLFFFFSKAKVNVIDKGRREKRALTRRRNKIFFPLKSTFERYADVFQKSGFDFKLEFTSIYSNEYEIAPEVESLLLLPANKRIGIAPFAKHEGKIYPIEAMEIVVKKLTSYGAYIYLFGGGGYENQILKSWESKFSNCIVVGDRLNLSEELQLIAKLDVMLSMDSANMHLASLVNTKVISIWGATHPNAGFLGWGQDIKSIVQTELSCRPCSVYGNKACFRKDYACMRNISPGEIFTKVIDTI